MTLYSTERKLAQAKWINLFRSSSQLFAGIKIAAAFLSYLSIGQIGKWLFEVFYPFTRIMWSDFLLWLQLPDITDIEKDALTALLFFLPLGLSAVVSRYMGTDEENISRDDLASDRRTAIFFGAIFFFLICAGILSNIREII